MKFTRTSVEDLEGKPIMVYTSGPYEISKNFAVRKEGKIVRWDYEVLYESFDTNRYPGRVARTEVLGHSRFLDDAKNMAREHAEHM